MNKKIFAQLKAISKRLKKEYNAEKVILFGSYAKGEETKDSDVDVLIIAPTNERFFERMATVRACIRDLCHGIPFQPIALKPDEVNKRLKRGDQFVKQILEEGIVL